MKNSVLFYKVKMVYILSILYIKSNLIFGSHIYLQNGGHIMHVTLPGDNQHSSFMHTISCPLGTTGIYSYPFNGLAYINCFNCETFIQHCPHGTRFSVKQKQCIRQTSVTKPLDNNNTDYQYLFKCPYGKHDIKYLYPFNATKYIQCTATKLEVRDCGPSEVFSVSNECCLPESQVLSTDRVQIPTQHLNPTPQDDIIYCSIDIFGVYPHPFNNTKYLKCVYGHLYENSCRSDLTFNIYTKFCEISPSLSLPPVQNSYSAESTIETRLNDSLTFLRCPGDLTGRFIYPFNCSKYVYCSSGETKILTCLVGEIYSIWHEKCMARNQIEDMDHVDCVYTGNNIDSEDPKSLGVYCAAKGIMRYPHPQDWHKYVLCNNGAASIKYCPRNQVFSREIKNCIDETLAMKAEEE